MKTNVKIPLLILKRQNGICASSLNIFERERERERREREREKIILLSGLRPITTGVNIQTIRILMDPMTDLNSVL